MKFFIFCIISYISFRNYCLWNNISIKLPTNVELLRYLNIKLIERVIIRLRNFWLGEYHYYSNDIYILLNRLVKEVYWWWRIYVFIDKGTYHETCQSLLNEIKSYNDMSLIIPKLLKIYQERNRIKDYSYDFLFEALNQAADFMINSYYKIEKKVNRKEES